MATQLFVNKSQATLFTRACLLVWQADLENMRITKQFIQIDRITSLYKYTTRKMPND